MSEQQKELLGGVTTDSLTNLGLIDPPPPPVHIITGGDPIPSGELVQTRTVTFDDISSGSQPQAVSEVETEEQLVQLECPSWLREASTPGCYNVELYSAKCLKCPYLIETPSSAERRTELPMCHIQIGNPRCPAGTMRILLSGKNVVKIDSLVNRVQKARETGDPDLIELAMSQVFEADAAVKTAVLSRIGLI